MTAFVSYLFLGILPHCSISLITSAEEQSNSVILLTPSYCLCLNVFPLLFPSNSCLSSVQTTLFLSSAFLFLPTSLFYFHPLRVFVFIFFSFVSILKDFRYKHSTTKSVMRNLAKSMCTDFSKKLSFLVNHKIIFHPKVLNSICYLLVPLNLFPGI